MMGQSPRDLEHLADTWFIACRAGNLSLLVTLLFSGERFSNLSFLLHLPHPSPPRPDYVADPALAAEAVPLLGTSAANMTGLHLALSACFSNWDPEPFARHSPDTLRLQRKRLVMQIIEASTVSALECRFGEANTALHLAAFLGDLDIVNALLRKGVASGGVENGLKKSPWQLARGPHAEELRRLLRREVTAAPARTQAEMEPDNLADGRIAAADSMDTATGTGITQATAAGNPEGNATAVSVAGKAVVCAAAVPPAGAAPAVQVVASVPATLLSTKRALETSDSGTAGSLFPRTASASSSGRSSEDPAPATFSSPHSCERHSMSDESASKSLRLSPDDEDAGPRHPQSRTALSSPLTRCLTVSETAAAPLVDLSPSPEAEEASVSDSGAGDQPAICFGSALLIGKLVRSPSANVTPFQRLSISGQVPPADIEPRPAEETRRRD